MAVVKFSVRAALVVVAMLAASAQVAKADTTMLICNLEGQVRGSWQEDEPTTIELNEAKSTVVVHFAKTHIDTGVGYPQYGEAFSIGPLPATFSDNTISFSDPHPHGMFRDFTINRLTGAFNGGDTQKNWFWKWTCHAGKKQF